MFEKSIILKRIGGFFLFFDSHLHICARHRWTGRWEPSVINILWTIGLCGEKKPKKKKNTYDDTANRTQNNDECGLNIIIIFYYFSNPSPLPL